MKDTPVFAAGSPYTFANTGKCNKLRVVEKRKALHFSPRHQVFMEGAGVLFRPRYNGMLTTAFLMW
jgi:hypothetical protein